MNRLRLLVLLGLSLVLGGTSVAKDHERSGRDRDDTRWHHRDRDDDHDRDDRIRRRHHDHHDRRSVLSRYNSSHPPGWDRGRKTGWGNCNLPPGQAKKSGCNTAVARRHHRRVLAARRDRDRDRNRGHDEDRDRH
jgi:hypothetical protein